MIEEATHTLGAKIFQTVKERHGVNIEHIQSLIYIESEFLLSYQGINPAGAEVSGIICEYEIDAVAGALNNCEAALLSKVAEAQGVNGESSESS